VSIFACELDGKNADQDRWKLFAYSLAASAFGIDALWVVDPAGLLDTFSPHEPDKLELMQIDSLSEAVSLHDGPVVVVEESQHGGTPVERFEHPHNALYLFGSDLGAGIHMPGERVYIESGHALYGHQAALLVAADRHRRRKAANQ